MKRSNLYDGLPAARKDELVEILARSDAVRVERIVSTGQVSADGFWYEQEEHEFVAVLKGSAVLRFDCPAERVEMREGDAVLIPAGRRHRVEKTGNPTVWLAVFFGGEL